MDIYRIEKFKGGWFIGDFDPAVFKTKDFEVCFKFHKQGELWDTHYHKIAEEINYLIRGKMKIGDILIEAGDIFHIHRNEVSAPVFLEDCELIVVKTPSVQNDKFIVNNE